MTARPGRLRELLLREGALICPGVVSPMFGVLAERTGFDAIYATGAGISNTWLGMPDLGLMGMSELLAVTGRIVNAVNIPVLADIDTGYGNVLNVTRTVREFEQAGVAGIQIEDQVNPKRCGHFDDKEVVSTDEMVERILAAAEARRDPDLVIVARTDALSVEGLSSAIERAHHYVAAGADMIFVEAPTTHEQLRTIGAELVEVPLVVNMVEGGRTPVLAAEELAGMGFKVILYANTVLRMAIAGASRALQALHDTGGSSQLIDEMASWDQRQDIVGLDTWLAIDRGLSTRAIMAKQAAMAKVNVESGDA
jgi:2-methylisocitrate lyase-like PEP mutase family enzyme